MKQFQNQQKSLIILYSNYEEAPGDLRVETIQNQWLALGKWSCPLDMAPKLTMG